MESKDIIASLDVGSSKVAVLIGKTASDSAQIDVIGVGKSKINSLRKGIIVDLEATISSISEALEQAERMSGLKIDRVILGLGGAHIESQTSKGVIAVSHPNGEVTHEDRDRAVEAAQAIAQPTNREILHVIPQAFVLDGAGGIKDPLGMNGIRLEVETHIITTSTPAIKNLEKCVFQSGLSIIEPVFNVLAESETHLSNQQKEIGVVLIDIGAATTQIIVYEEGTIIHSAVIPLGGSLITNDLAIGLKTSLEIAEQVKIKHGSATPAKISETKTVDLSKIDENEKGSESEKYIAEIIEARLSEILEMVRNELKKVKKDAKLPAGAVFTGGSSQIDGLLDLSKEVLKLPSNLSHNEILIGGMTDRIDDPSFAAALALLFWGKQHATGNAGHSSQMFKDISGRFRDFWKMFKP
ncbi:MAG: cell division protein FtsA [Patescibacteria group bacterium]|nr:cell division protein FtsA [Patescibacteria group bacterium]